MMQELLRLLVLIIVLAIFFGSYKLAYWLAGYNGLVIMFILWCCIGAATAMRGKSDEDN